MITIETIKLKKEPDHFCEYLTHWTGRKKSPKEAFEILEIIVSSLELKFTRNLVSFPDLNEKVSGSMICFTETPLNQSRIHCQNYGHIGISFNKQALIEYGANPVLYLSKNRESNQKVLTNLIFFRSSDLKNEEKVNFNWFSSMLQPYNMEPENEKHLAEYYEKEWRISGRLLPYFYIEDEEKRFGKFNEYNFQGNIISKPSIDPKIADETFFLKFQKEIIERIIVPKDYKEKAMELMSKNNLDCILTIIEEN